MTETVFINEFKQDVVDYVLQYPDESKEIAKLSKELKNTQDTLYVYTKGY